MKKYIVFGAVALVLNAGAATAQTGPETIARRLDQKRITLFNGWSLTPAGKSVLLEDLPLNIALSPNGKFAAVTNNGDGRQAITLVDAGNGRILDNPEIHGALVGLQFSDDSRHLYVSGGYDDKIFLYSVVHDRLIKEDSIVLGLPWPKEKIAVMGLAADNARNRIYAVTKEDNSLYICDLKRRTVLKKVQLGAEAYTCLLSPDRRTLYISLWGGEQVVLFDTRSGKVTGHIQTDSHPNDMAVSHNGRFLFVANANVNTVSVIDLQQRKVLENMVASLYPGAPAGTTPNGVALSGDDKTLYVADADNNDLAVFDVSVPGKSRSRGFIPTGWYPTCVRVLGNRLFVTDGKGLSSFANPVGPNPMGHRSKVQHGKSDAANGPELYTGTMFKGTLSIIPVPDPSTLEVYSQAVYRNTPYRKKKELTASGEASNPIPRKPGEPTPIKHVFYVLKENRSYDQVLGDMPEGNGDPSICIFGEKVTPNEHAIAKEFVLLDNFYVNSEVSADGHNWSMAGYATDYVQKMWPSNYSGRGGNYDYGGGRKAAFPKKGFIWDYCHRAGVSYRNYGEFFDDGYFSPLMKELQQHTCRAYPGWNLNIQDVFREKIWEKDFDSLLAIGAVPKLCIVYLPDDHTSGLAEGAYTPIAHVADNDLALGRLVDHISHSKIWGSSAIFVLEDDAQNGPDHVDAHRSPGFVISPYIRKGTVNHTLYSTASMLHTIELIAGLPPMSQYDAAATSMRDCFQNKPDLSPYTSKAAEVDINARNGVNSASAKLSATFDLSRPDAVPDRELNEVVWKSVKGENSIMPAPRRSAFVKVMKDDGD